MSLTYQLEALGVGSAVTVDSGADNGFLNCSCGAYGGCMKHDSTASAFNNLAGVLQAMTAGTKNPILSGHGSDGIVITGEGQSASDPSKFMMTWNEYAWGSEADKLKPKAFPIFTIISCHTGAGQSGADFLFALARRLNHPVQARTGFTYCGGNQLTFEANSTWQVATPTMKPNPINAPTPHFVPEIGTLKIEVDAVDMQLDMNSSVTVSLHQAPIQGQKGAQIFSLSGDGAKALLCLIDFGNPFSPNGAPAAIVTGILEVSGKDTSGAPVKASFTLYNDRLLQSDQSPNIFYRVSASFADTIRALRP